MNFTNRSSSTQQSQAQRGNAGSNGASGTGPFNATFRNASHTGTGRRAYNLMRGTWAVMLVSLTIILLCVVYLLHIANPNQGKYVIGSKLQAVFLANGQVYFGNIKGISHDYIDLQNIFYLNNGNSASGSSSTGNNLSLVKLGCELHGPYDEMVINSQQVTFWENLRSDGQVAKAVAQYKQQNPKGQTCSQSSQSTAQSTANTQNLPAPATTQNNSGSKQ